MQNKNKFSVVLYFKNGSFFKKDFLSHLPTTITYPFVDYDNNTIVDREFSLVSHLFRNIYVYEEK